MQKKLKLIASLAFVSLGVFALVPQIFARFNPGSGVTAQVASARDLYINNCARCHGIDGKGQTDLGKKYDVPDLTENGKNGDKARIVRIIKNGKQEMPAFAKKLTKKQIDALASFVKKL